MSEARENPSPKKIAHALQEGRVPRSRMMTGVFVLLTGSSALVVMAEGQVASWQDLAKDLLRRAGVLERPEEALGAMSAGLNWLLWACVPVLMMLFLGAIAGNLVSYRPVWAPGLLVPSWDRFRRGSSPITRGTTWLSLLAFLVGYGWIGWALWELIQGSSLWSSVAAEKSGALLGGLWSEVWWPLLGILVAFGVADLFLQRRSWWEGLKMTRAEVEEEAREQRQDPSLSRERSRLLRSERGFGLHRVAEASLLVFYESQGAVALFYEPGRPPQVVAVTRDEEQTVRMMSVARAQGRPLWRDEALTGALRSLEEGAFLPEALFREVAHAMKNA